MKVLMVNKFLYPKGGAETYMLDLGKSLSESGCEVQYFGMDSEQRCAENQLHLYVNEIDYHNATLMQKLSSPVKTIYSKEARDKIGKVLDAFQPDIVHMNNINFQLTPSIIYAAKERNIPIVQTVHDVQLACPNHRLYIEQEERICTECTDGKFKHCIKNRCVHGSALRSGIAAAESYYYHKRKTYQLIDRYICPSRFMADTIHNAGIDSNKITVLPNYAPQISFTCEPAEEKYIIYFGRISVEKGLKLLFEVMEEMPDVKLLLAGTGPLEEELKERGLKNVEFLGFQKGEALYRYIAGATACVYPSQWYENCPMSIIEAITLGTPVITCDIGGAKELIDDGNTGIIYKAEDKASLKSAIERLFFDEALAKKMRDNCKQNGCTMNINTYTHTLLNLYQELCK